MVTLPRCTPSILYRRTMARAGLGGGCGSLDPGIVELTAHWRAPTARGTSLQGGHRGCRCRCFSRTWAPSHVLSGAPENHLDHSVFLCKVPTVEQLTVGARQIVILHFRGVPSSGLKAEGCARVPQPQSLSLPLSPDPPFRPHLGRGSALVPLQPLVQTPLPWPPHFVVRDSDTPCISILSTRVSPLPQAWALLEMGLRVPHANGLGTDLLCLAHRPLSVLKGSTGPHSWSHLLSLCLSLPDSTQACRGC